MSCFLLLPCLPETHIVGWLPLWSFGSLSWKLYSRLTLVCTHWWSYLHAISKYNNNWVSFLGIFYSTENVNPPFVPHISPWSIMYCFIVVFPFSPAYQHIQIKQDSQHSLRCSTFQAHDISDPTLTWIVHHLREALITQLKTFQPTLVESYLISSSLSITCHMLYQHEKKHSCHSCFVYLHFSYLTIQTQHWIHSTSLPLQSTLVHSPLKSVFQERH